MDGETGCVNELQAFFKEHHFYLLKKKKETDKLWLFRLEHMAEIFSKMNKISLSLQGKQLTALLPMIKFEL